MAKSGSIKERIKTLMKKHPGVEADELYPLAPFKTAKQYFDIIYNEHKYQEYPQHTAGLRRRYPKLYHWIHDNYEDTDLKISEIAEKFEIEQLLVVHMKRVLGLLKYPSDHGGLRATVFAVPKILKEPSVDLEIGDIIKVTKHNRVTARDVFVLGRCRVIFKNKYYISIRDAVGQVHGFSIQLLNNYIEYKEVSN